VQPSRSFSDRTVIDHRDKALKKSGIHKIPKVSCEGTIVDIFSAIEPLHKSRQTAC
jgi:hypothetical protein